MTAETRLDLLADDVLDRLRPMTFARAETVADIDAVLRMRYECVIEEGWGEPADHPDGRERDAYDDDATHVLGRDGAELVGSVRLIPPVPGRMPLIEKELGIRLDAAERALEAGRLVIPRRHRHGRSHHIMTGLFARGWLLARQLGYDRVVGQASPAILDLYRQLGLTVVVLGEPTTYFGEARYPIEIAGAEQRLSVAWLDERDA